MKTRPEITDGPKSNPAAPEVPTSDEMISQISGLDGWAPSEDPQEGRFVDHDDDCDCPTCE